MLFVLPAHLFLFNEEACQKTDPRQHRKKDIHCRYRLCICPPNDIALRGSQLRNRKDIR